jgi:propionyl-CoA carboxylase alpha chain
MHRVAEIRRARISGRLGNHERTVGTDWVVRLAEREVPARIHADRDGATVEIDGATHRVVSDWRPGTSLARVQIDDHEMALKVDEITCGFRIRTHGADLRVQVFTPMQAEFARHIPQKEAADTSKLLLCPMPGLMVTLDVAEGEEVQQGQPLCTVEAMKMENILRAERKATVAKINAGPGDSLAVDDVIMEFE